MTTFGGDGAPRTVVQAPPGLLAGAPSARSPDHPQPRADQDYLRRGPDRDAGGRPLWLATPSPCPPDRVLLAGAPVSAGAVVPEPGAYGLYLARDDWPEGPAPAGAVGIDLQLVFDDPELVDAEPVAVYEREFRLHEPGDETRGHGTPPPDLALANGRGYRGPMGQVFATGLDTRTLMGDLPGQRTDAGTGPVFDGPPAGAIDHLRVYAARRDRFDDPVKPRIAGEWEWILKVPVKDGAAGTWAPTDAPTALAGFDRAGRVVEWTTAAADAGGHAATFYAYAGDHYSLTRPLGRHFCVGCHPGHSGLPASGHEHAERVR
jgi:hypothetical protein